MHAERRVDILIRLARSGSGSGDAAPARLCEVCADVTAMTGAGIMLKSPDRDHGSICTTGPISALIEDLQYELGEGPCIDAFSRGRPVLEPDLADPVTARWMAFTPLAVEAGARAVFGFPLQIGAVRVGALNLYRDRPGRLDDDQYTDALILADIATQSVLAWQAGTPTGVLAPELTTGSTMQAVVHQASGMVAVQLGVDVGEALTRLRAYAFAHEQRLRDVAHEIVNRRLRFDPRTGDATTTD